VLRAGLFCALLLSAFAAKAEGLVDELRKGGYILYLRHTSTDFSRNDTKMASYEDCANQRPLLDKGRDEARAIAGHLKRLGIPVDRVYASPFCRTVETAMLAFGKAEKTSEARGGPLKSDDPKRYDALKRLLSTPPARGQNNAISSHGNPFLCALRCALPGRGGDCGRASRRQGGLRPGREDQARGLGGA
jgi:hypothetical protein